MRKVSVVCLAIFCLLITAHYAVPAKTAGASPTHKAIQWSSNNGKTLVFLVLERPPYTYALYVVGDRDMSVFYNTRRNSMVDVIRQLRPMAPVIKGVTVYKFRHRFSKTTPWMAVEFVKSGKRLDDLTRTFYGSIAQVVPNDKYLKPRK